MYLMIFIPHTLHLTKKSVTNLLEGIHSITLSRADSSKGDVKIIV